MRSPHQYYCAVITVIWEIIAILLASRKLQGSQRVKRTLFELDTCEKRRYKLNNKCFWYGRRYSGKHVGEF